MAHESKKPIDISDSYEVGDGKRPKRTRFKPPHCGISNARQKKLSAEGNNPMLALLMEPKSAIIRGKRAKLATFRLLWRACVTSALQGDYKAMKMLLNSTDNFENVRYHENRKIFHASPEGQEQSRKFAAQIMETVFAGMQSEGLLPKP